MYILGISAFYHDSAAALINKGEIVAAAQEERFTRIKQDSSFPQNAIKYVLDEAKISLKDVQFIVFYEKPFIKFERLLETYLSEAPKGFTSFRKAIPIWLKEKLFIKTTMQRELRKIQKLPKKDILEKLRFSEHHLSHAASAYYPSPFSEAAILTVDGVGEWTTTSLAHGSDNNIKIVKEINFPHSLGLLYSAFTYYIGFKVNSGEYKIMGLAPYGNPIYVNTIKEHLVDIAEDGSFILNMDYFNYTSGLTMTNDKFHNLFNGTPRKSESTITQKEMDLAASIQKVTEEVMIKMARYARNETGAKNLCLAGGVALNCVANGKILEEGIFDNIWIQPAAGDAGGALGAALAQYYYDQKQPRTIKGTLDSMKGAYLGKSYEKLEIQDYLDSVNATYRYVEDESELIEIVSHELENQKVVGWHYGRMEFGPRALGGRSIIGDARNTEMQKNMNLKIKYRESFRPFAPSVLRESVNKWFNFSYDSPYMLMVSPVHPNIQNKMSDDELKLFGIDKLNIKRSKIPAVTHVDYSARIQTVHSETNPRYHKLISSFEKKTGCSVIVNTSFNVRGEPIVCSPEDSYRCFMRTEMDVLVIDNYILYKQDQPTANRDKSNWQAEFVLD